MITAVIFDIDGTLVDSVDLHAEAWQVTLERFGKKVSFAEVRHQIGKGGDQLLPVFLSQREMEKFGEELEQYRSKLFKKQYLPRVTAFPGVRQLFERVRQDQKRIASGEGYYPAPHPRGGREERNVRTTPRNLNLNPQWEASEYSPDQ